MNRETLASLKSEVSKQFSGTTKYSKAFRRGNTQALDISQTFPTFEHAFAYALNDTENDNYVPYAGQVVSEAENGTVYILRKYSSDIKYIDLPIGEGETLESYEIKYADRFHYYLQEIKTVEGDNTKYLRADADSDNSGHTLTVGKIVSQKGADITGNTNVTGDISATGNVTGNNVTATGKITTPEVVTDGIHSEDADAQNGFSIGKEGNGGYTMYVDNLHVRNKMTTETLVIQETTFVGGKLVLTPGSGIECKKVEYGNYANGQGFKCWFTNEIDGVVKHNTFQVGDLALCESFNNNQSTFYWREVAECGDDYIILSDVEGKYHTESDSPKAGDKIVQCGNIYGGERASAIVLSAVDTGSPFVAQYKNIVTFEWTAPVTRLSEDGNIITGTLKTESGNDVEKYINDTNDTIEKLQEGMQSLGDNNFVIWQADYPSPKNDDNTISEEFNAESYEPSASWDNSEWNSHTGDYLVCSDGVVYVFRCVENQETEYVWKIVTDKYLIDALNKALQAQETADEAKEGADKANQILADISNDNIITPQEKTSLKDWWNNELNEANSIISNAHTIYGEEYDTSSNWYKFYALTKLATTLMNNVLSDMDSTTDISAEGSIFVSYKSVQLATKDNSIEGSVRTDKNLVWSEFWAIYYQYKATCQNTAEAKAKVFVTSKDTLPKPPYKVGDMWICPSYTNTVNIDGNPTPINYIKETFVCVNERKSGETASFDDWQVMYDETSSHLELLKDSIKLWVENNSGLAEKIKSGIDLLAEGVKIYTKSGEEINLISVGDDGIKINADLVDISGKNIDLTGDNITISSTNFKVSKEGNIEAKGGTIGGMTITDNGFTSTSMSSTFVFGKDGLSYNSKILDPITKKASVFSVNDQGRLFCNNAEIAGKITATSGKIANMDIASTEVSYQQQAEDGGYFSFGYDGIKAGYMTAEGDGYTPVATTTIGKDGTITAPNVEFNKDGSGHVAGGNIAWDKDGNASFRGEIQASGGSFMSEDKENMRKTTIDSQNGDFRMFAPSSIDENTGKPNQDASQNLIFEIRTYVDYDTNTTFPEINLIHAANKDIYVRINPLDGIRITNSDARIILGDTNGEHMTISPGGITVWNGNTELKSW